MQELVSTCGHNPPMLQMVGVAERAVAYREQTEGAKVPRPMFRCPSACGDLLGILTAGHCVVCCSRRAPAAWPSTACLMLRPGYKRDQLAWAAAESCLVDMLETHQLHAAAPA